MGFFLSKLVNVWEGFNNYPARIAMLGLDAAGKTQICFILSFMCSQRMISQDQSVCKNV